MIRLHHCHQTRSMRSLWLLHELGVDFELKVYPFDRALRSDAYVALNPTSRVPALEIAGQVIWESGAIAQYLCEQFPDAGMGRAPAHAERAKWLDWVHFAETISQHVAALTQQHIAIFEDHMRSPVVMKLESKRLAKTLGTVDAALRGQTYLLPSGFSAADIGVGQAVYMAQHFVALDPFEALQAWYARITERDAFQRSLPPDGTHLYAKSFYAPWDAVS